MHMLQPWREGCPEEVEQSARRDRVDFRQHFGYRKPRPLTPSLGEISPFREPTRIRRLRRQRTGEAGRDKAVIFRSFFLLSDFVRDGAAPRDSKSVARR